RSTAASKAPTRKRRPGRFLSTRAPGRPASGRVRGGLFTAQVVEHALGIGLAVGILVRTLVIYSRFLNLSLSYTFVHIHGLAPAPISEPEMLLVDEHAHAAGVLPIAVRDQLHVLEPALPSPLMHHESVVDAEAIYIVDSKT